ncbi:hypothetical protein Gpo141_00001950 [Globisporangium polare]
MSSPCAPAEPLNDSWRKTFKQGVVEKTQRKDKEDHAAGYYVSIDVTDAASSSAPAHERHDDTQLHQLVTGTGNTRLFIHSTLALNKQVDAIIPAASDEPLIDDQRKRIRQIRPHSTRTKLVEQIENGDKLLKRIRDRQDVVIAKDAAIRISTPMTTRSKAKAKVAPNPEQAKPGAVISPAAKTATAKPKTAKSKSVARALFPADDVATIDNIKSETGCFRAYELFLNNQPLFTFCLVYTKNANIDLATQILRRCKCNKKVAIRKWIREHVGPIPESEEVRASYKCGSRSSRRAFYIWELRNLALVAAALALYGERELSALLDSKSLEAWKKIALVSDELRDNPAQTECLKRAGKSKMKRMFHAAHCIGLDLAIRWNNSLAPEYRLSAEALRRILNFQCNLKAVPRSENLKDHSQADKFILFLPKHGDDAEPKNVTRSQLSNFRRRLVEIANTVQSQESGASKKMKRLDVWLSSKNTSRSFSTSERTG